MRLKEIKPGMAIHCKNDDEKKALLEEAERLGYRWNGNAELPTSDTVNPGSTIHFHKKDKFTDFEHITWSVKTEGVTEFSDIILPELTAEEAIKIRTEMCRKSSCTLCPISLRNNGEGKDCDTFSVEHTEKVVEILAKWNEEIAGNRDR